MAKQKKLTIPVPRWAALTYISLSALLIPWIIYLGASLPQHHLSAHWDISWTGLDVAIFFGLLLTGLLAHYKSRFIAITASTVGSFLLVDAWFDIMSERRRPDLIQAVVLAAFIELPLAGISYVLAYRALHNDHYTAKARRKHR